MKQVKRKLTLIRSSQNLKKFGFYGSPSTVGIDSIHLEYLPFVGCSCINLIFHFLF